MEFSEFKKMWGDFHSLRVIMSRDATKDALNGYTVALYGRDGEPYRMSRVGRIHGSPFGIIEFAPRFLRAHPSLRNVFVVRERSDTREFVYSIHDKATASAAALADGAMNVLRQGEPANTYNEEGKVTPHRPTAFGSSMVLGEVLPSGPTLEPGPRYDAQADKSTTSVGEAQYLSGVMDTNQDEDEAIPHNVASTNQFSPVNNVTSDPKLGPDNFDFDDPEFESMSDEDKITILKEAIMERESTINSYRSMIKRIATIIRV